MTKFTDPQSALAYKWKQFLAWLFRREIPEKPPDEK